MAGGPGDDPQLPFGAVFAGAAVKNADDDGSAEPAVAAVVDVAAVVVAAAAVVAAVAVAAGDHPWVLAFPLGASLPCLEGAYPSQVVPWGDLGVCHAHSHSNQDQDQGQNLPMPEEARLKTQKKNNTYL